jgi:aspartate aminotransferase-like enzyme
MVHISNAGRRSQRNCKKADKIEVDWGEAITPDMLRDALKQKHYEAVTLVHNETSTGVENPVKDLCAVVQEVSPDTLVMVDAVSSLSGVKIEMDAWGIDFLLTSSQKCLGCHLSGFGRRLRSRDEKAESVQNRGWYFDLLLMEKTPSQRLTPHDPRHGHSSTPLDFQLDRIFRRRLENPLRPPRRHVQEGTGLVYGQRHDHAGQGWLSLQRPC